MKKYRITALLLSLAVLLCGCAAKTTDTTPSKSEENTAKTESSTPIATADMFTERDSRTEYDSAVDITLNGDSAACASDSVEIAGSTVTIKGDGTYVISGTLDDGMIKVDADDTAKPQLVLDNVSVTSKTSAALYILNADKVFVTLKGENTLANGGGFEAVDDNSIDGAVFSKQDLTFNGDGTLAVSSPAAHGIVCKDDLVLVSGVFTVNSASHGIDANDSVRVKSAALTVDSGKDGIHSENTDDASLGFVYIAGGSLDIEAEGDGISAGAYAQIDDGSISILAGGGSENGDQKSSGGYGGFMGGGRGPVGMSTDSSIDSSTDSTSMKGIKAQSGLTVTGGTLTVNSADDALHSDTDLTVSGGTLSLASGDDGIHAEETLTVTAGDIDISESYEGLEALDIKVSGGDIKLTASDDGFNAAGGNDQSGFGGRDNGMFGGPMGGGMSSGNGSIVISGGNIYINASGDGVDANGTLEISGGYTVVVGPTQGDTATLDYDKSAVISGGTFIGTGGAGMAQSFSDSEGQGIIAVSVGNRTAGTAITLADKSGKTLVDYAPELDFAVVIISSPDIVSGDSYTLSVGSDSSDIEAS